MKCHEQMIPMYPEMKHGRIHQFTCHPDEQESLQAMHPGITGHGPKLTQERATTYVALLRKTTHQEHIQCLQKVDYQQETMFLDAFVVHKSGLHPNYTFTFIMTPLICS